MKCSHRSIIGILEEYCNTIGEEEKLDMSKHPFFTRSREVMNNKGLKPKTRIAIEQKIIHLTSAVVSDQKRMVQMMGASIAPLSEQSPRLTRWISVEDTSFMLFDAAVTEYDDLVEQLLLQEGWNEKFSESYLTKAIQRVIVSLLQGTQTERCEHPIELLCESFYRYDREHIIYIPLSGIKLHTETFPMGNIVFRYMTDAFVAELTEKMRTIFILTLNSPEAKEANHVWAAQRLETLRGTVCAEYTVVAEPQRAQERAEEEVRCVLDLLRYAISVLYSRGLHVAVGLQGEVMSVIRTTPILALDGQSIEIHTNRDGALCDFEFSTQNIEKMEQIGLLKVAALLACPEKQTDFERHLLRGIHWFAASQTQVERENELLNLMTCLETFLSDGKFITNAVAVGTAHLLAIELDARRDIKRKLQDLYGMRSGVSHGGQKAILEQNLVELRAIAKALIFQLITRKDEFLTKKAFAYWLEERQLVG